MAITVACPSCNATFEAPESASGKKTKCPKCGQLMMIPEVVEAGAATEAAPGENRRPCPMCGEMIMASAVKCRFCGEILYPALRQPGNDLTERGSMGLQTYRRPAVPASIQWAIALYVVSFVLGFLSGLTDPLEPPHMDRDEAMAFLGVACIAFAIGIADLVGFVVACCGYSWGAILNICTTAVGFVISLPFMMMITADGGFPLVLSVFDIVGGIGSMILLIVPASWEYYRKCADYRLSRR